LAATPRPRRRWPRRPVPARWPSSTPRRPRAPPWISSVRGASAASWERRKARAWARRWGRRPATSPRARSRWASASCSRRPAAGDRSPAIERLSADARTDEAKRVYEQLVAGYPGVPEAIVAAQRALRMALPPPAARAPVNKQQNKAADEADSTQAVEF